jgi:hypothetical protein
MSWTYIHSDRVRFGDLDPMGHVNNVDFLRFFESARIAFHRTIVDEHDVTRPPAGFGVVVAEVHAVCRACRLRLRAQRNGAAAGRAAGAAGAGREGAAAGRGRSVGVIGVFLHPASLDS